MAGDEHSISRRLFLARLLKTSAVAGATVGMGRYFQDRDAIPVRPTPGTISPFNVAGTEGVFGLARGENPYATTRAAVETVGGMRRFVGAGEKVLIKVNGAFARPAWVGATSSPQVTAEVVKLCYEAGASRVKVTDNPISDARSCFSRSGLSEAVERVGGEVLLPRPARFARIRVNDGVIGTWEVFHEPLAWCDKLIGIPTVKTHNLCGVSLAMKNWYGFFGGSRSRFHQDIHRVIVELAEFITPTLVILDGTRMLIRNGPTGGSAEDVVPGNTVATSTDQVAIDAWGAEMLGVDRSDAAFIDLAEGAGLGTADYRHLPHFAEEAR